MSAGTLARKLLAQEARALLTRVDRVKPFALHETMVPAAAISTPAQAAIENFLIAGRRKLRGDVRTYLRWLAGSGRRAAPEEMQRRFTFLRLRFNAVLSQFDIFSSAITQRSENEIGVWLAGLDEVATDALTLAGGHYQPPPVICHLDRGMGAAIRRARTRLPGGGPNPVAVIRVPRERMVGAGIASSLIHEVGHQGAALLDLLPSLRAALAPMVQRAGRAWLSWHRWISEIVADFWSVASLGVSSTLGLLAVVSLPRAFVFRENADDPHPTPWIRVKLSCAMGKALFPHPQWDRLAALWEQLYPLDGIPPAQRRAFAALEASMPAFVRLLIDHRPKSLRGMTLREALPVAERQPARLSAIYRAWRTQPGLIAHAKPTLVFAVLGQARSDGALSPEAESRVLGGLLTRWALQSALESSVNCAALPRKRAAAA